MRRPDAATWAGLFMTAVCIVVGIPVAMSYPTISVTLIAQWAWVTMFTVFIASLIITTWLSYWLPKIALYAILTVQVLAGASLVIAAPTAGWLPILLVFTAASSVYLVPIPATIVVIVLNTIAIGISALFSEGPPIALVTVVLIYLILQIGTCLSIVAQLRESRMRRELAAAHVELRAASALLAESSRADERLRISRELHDLIGHQLTVLILELEVARHKSDSPTSDHIERAKDVARNLLGDVRSTVDTMRRSSDLSETLQDIVAGLPFPKIDLQIDVAGELDEAKASTLVRCVQEVITNTIRHAEAEHLTVQILQDEHGAVTLSAFDDGVGAKEVTPGNGLRGMRERIEALGGRVSFRADDGFRVTATVPA